jgi:two-component system response regulator HydG
MKDKYVLIVDDSRDMLEVVSRQLKDLGFQTFQVTNVMDAVDMLKGRLPDLLITDIQMPGVDGMKLIQYASEHYPNLPLMVITGYPSVQNAVDAVQLGAFDYLVKPFTKTELEKAVNKTLLKGGINSINDDQKSSVKGDLNMLKRFGIIGNSEVMTDIERIIDRIKNTRVTVLVTGESGTGKELIARAIHYSGNTSKSPFIAVNCGAIPENLLESELFGYTKGAFTGADSTRAGFFQAADGGSIFLDEINSASLAVQQRLLRVLQEKEVMMIGSNKPQKIDIRVIAATNANLLKLIEKGTFREDLFYRLNVINIEMPPLRKRPEDIPILANFFIRKFASELETKVRSISERAIKILGNYRWPGNIRELENTIQRSMIMADEKIDVEQLPDFVKMSSPQEENPSSWQTLEEVQRKYIEKVLHSVEGNKTQAAKILGIDRKTLREKLK